MRYRHFVFDLDGTLIDSVADLAAAINRLRTRLDVDALAVETVGRFIGDGARKLVERATADAAGVDVEQALSLFREDYARHCLDRTRLYPGVRRMMECLRARGVRMSVLTNKPQSVTEAIVDGLGIRELLGGVVGGAEGRALKPDPAALRDLVREGALPAWRTLVIGDSLVDCGTALNAGVDFCGVLWGLRPGDLRDVGWIRVVERPDELLAMFGADKTERAHAGRAPAREWR